MPDTRWISDWLHGKPHHCWKVEWVMVNHQKRSIELIKWDESSCVHRVKSGLDTAGEEKQ